MADQRIRLDEIVDGTSITVDPLTGKLRSTPINTVATGIGILDPVRFFARPTSAATPPAGVTVTTAHQDMLGHGKEFTLPMFGWVGGDIYAAFQAAVTACHSAGGGTVQLPAGRLTCSAAITVPSNLGAFGGIGRGIMIRGKGRGTTDIEFPHAVVIAIDFGSDNTSSTYSTWDGIERLSISTASGISTGKGLRFRSCVACQIRDVSVTGFAGTGGIGIHLSTIVQAITQDVLMSNVNCGANYIGMLVDGVAQMHCNQCMWNQNSNTQLKITNLAAGQFTGCLIQGTSDYGLWMAPDGSNSITASFTTFYTEGTFANGTVRYEGGSNEGFMNFNGVIASATNSPVFFDLDGCHAVIEGASYIPANATRIKARNMKSLTVVGEAAPSSYYDFDTTSARATTWVSPGGMAVGMPAPIERNTAPNLRARTYSKDGAFYDTLPATNFIEMLSGIWGELLRATWHAGLGISADTAPGGTGALYTWTDQINRYVLVPPSASPLWLADGSNFLSQPVVQCAGANTAGLRLATASPAIFLTGEAPALCGVARWRSNANNASLFDVGINAVSDPNRIWDDATNHVATIAGTGVTGPAFGTTQHRWFLRTDGATTSVLTIDDTDYTTGSGATLGADQTAIGVGANASGVSGFATVSVACLILLSGQGTAAQRAATKRLLVREFG